MAKKKPQTAKSCCPLTGDAVLRASADEVAASLRPHFPAGLSKPALCALAHAGYTSMDQLHKTTASEILALHGMGPKGVKILQAELKKQGRALRP